MRYPRNLRALAVVWASIAAAIGVAAPAHAWDHGGHMTTAAIAFEEIRQQHPELIPAIGTLLRAHPDPAPFSASAGDSSGEERVRRAFIECARWPDDARWTVHDRPAWHTARWAIVDEQASKELRGRVDSRGSGPAGTALEALALNYAVLAYPGSQPSERATSLCWVLHLVGDIHQPLHTSEYYSDALPNGNGAGLLQFVSDPESGRPIQLHMLWDRGFLRSTNLDDVYAKARDVISRHPRRDLVELRSDTRPDNFYVWAHDESFAIAKRFAYGLRIPTALDPDTSIDTERLVKAAIAGVVPVSQAPDIPPGYLDELHQIADRRIGLAGYRIAQLVIAALGHP